MPSKKLKLDDFGWPISRERLRQMRLKMRRQWKLIAELEQALEDLPVIYFRQLSDHDGTLLIVDETNAQYEAQLFGLKRVNTLQEGNEKPWLKAQSLSEVKRIACHYGKDMQEAVQEFKNTKNGRNK